MELQIFSPSGITDGWSYFETHDLTYFLRARRRNIKVETINFSFLKGTLTRKRKYYQSTKNQECHDFFTYFEELTDIF